VSEATAKREPMGDALPTSSDDVCATAQLQINAGDVRGAQRTLLALVRTLPDDPLPFRLLGEAFLRSGDAHRAERALAHARGLEIARGDRGDEVIDRGTEAWLHRARSLKKTQSMLGYQAVADAVAQSAPPTSSASGVREKVTDDALDEEDHVALDVRLNHERRRARALEAQPTRRIEPPSELLELAAQETAADPTPQPEPEPEPEAEPPVPIAHASEAEIEVLVASIAEEQAAELARARSEARAKALAQASSQALEHAIAQDRWILWLTVGACAMLLGAILGLLAALGFFR
jgi:hypothetical protein